MNHFFKKNYCYGFATMEMLIAMAIMVLVISAMIPLISGEQSTSVGSETSQEALYKAQAVLENVRTTARQDLGQVQNCDDSTTTKCSKVPDSFYTVKLVVNNIDDVTKKVTSQVAWQNNSVQISTIFTDWQAALGTGACNQNPTGDWKHPQLLGNADIGQDNEGTNVDASSKKAYVTANSSDTKKGDFYIIDVSDPKASDLPILNIGGLNTGPGLAAVKVAGKYAYVANMSRTAQLQIIDISDAANPFVAKSFKLTNVTGTGSQATGKSIFYANKKVYLGLTKTGSGPEFNIIDVSDFLENPSNNPILVGSWSAGTTINTITVKNNTAYLATPWPSSNPPTKENASILDVSSPATVHRINTFSAPNASTMSGESVYISNNGSTLYLGRAGINAAKNPVFFLLDMQNPTATPLPIVNSKYIATTSNIAIHSIIARSNLAFLLTSDPNLSFQIWDTNDLSSATPYASINTPQPAASGMDCDGDLIYVTQKSNKALQIIAPAEVAN